MNRAWLAVPLIALAACGSLELRPDETSAAEWASTGKMALFASKYDDFRWTSGGVPLEFGGRSIADAVEFPVFGSVSNASSEPVTIRIRHAVSDGSSVVGERGWRRVGEPDSPIVYDWAFPIVDGEPFVLPGSHGSERLRLRADRVWTPDDPMRVGDTVSYDIEIESASGTTTCRLRMVIARRWSDTFDEWWQPIVWVPFLPVGFVWFGILFIVTGGDIVNILP